MNKVCYVLRICETDIRTGASNAGVYGRYATMGEARESAIDALKAAISTAEEEGAEPFGDMSRSVRGDYALTQDYILGKNIIRVTVSVEEWRADP